MACDSEAAHQRCAALFENLKLVSLPAFSVPEDPAQMPHSVLLKIQFGGLLGIQGLLGRTGDRVADICDLVEAAEAQFQELDAIPCTELAQGITAYKIKRRRVR